MFRSLRNVFDDLREKAADAISNFFGRGEERAEQSAPSEPGQVINADNQDAPIEQAFEEFEEEIIDTDDEEESFSDYLQELDDYVLWGANAEEVRTFDPDTIDPQYLRVVRYATLDEARTFLEEAGLLEFAEVLYIEDEDLFTIAVYDSPGVI